MIYYSRKLCEKTTGERCSEPVARALASEYVSGCFELVGACSFLLVLAIYGFGCMVSNDKLPQNLSTLFVKLVLKHPPVYALRGVNFRPNFLGYCLC